MLYEMIIMSSTSQLYCQTKMNLKKGRVKKREFFQTKMNLKKGRVKKRDFCLSFSAKKGHFLQWILFCKQIKLYLIWQEA